MTQSAVPQDATLPQKRREATRKPNGADVDIVSGVMTGSQPPAKRQSVVSAQTERRWELREQTKTATLLDALVRNTRGASTPGELAERLVERWREDPELTIEVRPTRLLVGELDVETATEGRSWTYFAFMAGLRSVGMTDETGPADLQRLAQRITELRLDVHSAQSFRDWAWEEDGEGLSLVVTRTFSEVFEQAPTSFDAAATTLTAVRGEQALPMGIGVLADTQDLDRAATRPEYEVSLLDYQAKVAQRDHEISAPLLRGLSQDAGSTYAWALAEFSTIVGNEALRHTLPPARVARRLAEVWNGPAPQKAPPVLETLRRVDPPYADRVAAELTTRSVVLALLHNEQASAQVRRDALRQWLGCDPEPAREVLRGILARVQEHPDAVDELLTDLLRGEDAPAVIGAIVEESMSPPRAVWLAQRVERSGLAPLLAGLGPKAKAAALCARPAVDLHEHKDQILALLEHDEPRATLVEQLAVQKDATISLLLREIMAASAQRSWTPRMAALVCHRIRSVPQGDTLLVDIAASRRTDHNVRVAALSSLRGTPALLQRAAKWSWAELFAPANVRTALKDARRSLSP